MNAGTRFGLKKMLHIAAAVAAVWLTGSQFAACKTACPSQPDPLVIPKSDTTTHNYVWTVDTLGDDFSFCTDVWASSDSDVWAAGNFTFRDSTGGISGVERGLAHWNGTAWTYSRPDVTWDERVLGFSAHDVWIAYQGPSHWDGFSWKPYFIGQTGVTGEVQRIWGTSSNNLYMGFSSGGLIHFDGKSWRPVPSFTNAPVTDIAGSRGLVWQCSDAQTTGVVGGLWELTNGTWHSLCKVGHPKSGTFDSIVPGVTTAWASEDTLYAVGGYSVNGAYGLYRIPLDNADRRGLFTSIQSVAGDSSIGFINAIRGSSARNIFMVGDLGTLLHFNGATWHNYTASVSSSFSLQFVSVLPRSFYVAAISGTIATRAIVIRGHAL